MGTDPRVTSEASRDAVASELAVQVGVEVIARWASELGNGCPFQFRSEPASQQIYQILTTDQPGRLAPVPAK